MSALKIAIAGVNGRMGRVLVEAVNNHPDAVSPAHSSIPVRKYWVWMQASPPASKPALPFQTTWMPYWLKAMSSSTLPAPSQP